MTELATQRRERERAAKILGDRVVQRRAPLVVELVPPVGERDEIDERTDVPAQHRRLALDVRGLRRRQRGVQLAGFGLTVGQRGGVLVLAVDQRHDAVEHAQRVLARRLPRRAARALGLHPLERADERVFLQIAGLREDDGD